MNCVSLQPMTREMCHVFYRQFQNDPAIGHYYDYVYTPQTADRYYDNNLRADRKMFAIMVDGKIVGECKLKNIDFEKRECSMGIHLQNDSVKGKGYGTQAERLILRYAFEDLGMDAVNAEAFIKNTRSQHVLEKAGFRYIGEDDRFKFYRCENPIKVERVRRIRQAEEKSHTEAYSNLELFAPGSWLEKPVKTVVNLLPLFDNHTAFRGLDLGCGIGRNCIPVAQYFQTIPCRLDCVDVLGIAIEKLQNNAAKYGVDRAIHGINASIDAFKIEKNAYDLILAVSALEHVESVATFEMKLLEIRDGLRDKGVACFIVNSGVTEHDKESGMARAPQFEVNLPTEQMEEILLRPFEGWEIIKHTIVHQKYDIPREGYISALETDVITLIVRKGK